MADQASIKLSESEIIIGRKFNNSKLIITFFVSFNFKTKRTVLSVVFSIVVIVSFLDVLKSNRVFPLKPEV
jgi:hypothetical protein